MFSLKHFLSLRKSLDELHLSFVKPDYSVWIRLDFLIFGDLGA
jgi:hypothetical protein